MTLIEARVSLATLYFKAKDSFKILIVVLQVNDLIFFIGNDEKMIEKKMMEKKTEMSDEIAALF